METLLLKMLLSWAIMIIGFVALFAGCNNTHSKHNAGNAYSSDGTNDPAHDTALKTPPDNTRADGVKERRLQDTAVMEKAH